MRRATVRRSMKRRNERGFALLLVFLMASAVALMLYRQMPREAFESERDKEQMLIDRGEQYKRAIYMYYVGNNRQWPTKIEDLESTNNHRYLRRRYIDPYTGKDEWRLIHTNGTFLTDSLVTPPPQATPGGLGAPGSATASAPLGGTGMLTNPLTATTATTTDPNAPPEVNAQVGRRPSDRTLVQNSDFAGAPSQSSDPGYQPFNPASLPPISLYPNGYNAPPVNAPGGTQPVAPGLNLAGQPGVNPPNQPGFNQPGQGFNQPGFNQPGFNQPGFNQPGQPGFNQPVINQPGVPGFTIPGTNSPITTPGVNGSSLNSTNFNQPGGLQPINPTNPTNQPQQFPLQLPNQGSFSGAPGAPGTAPTNPAIGLINNLLTTPRQAPTGVGQQPTTGGGGLAGVASTHKGAAIKSYGDRTKYQEWEFIFQLNPQGTLQAPQGGLKNGQPTGGPLSNPGVTGTPGAPGAPGNTGGITTGGANSGNTTGGFGTN